MLHAILVDAHVAKLAGVRNSVPDDIVAAFTRGEIVVEARDWIAKHLLAFWKIEREVRVNGAQRFRGEIGLVGCSSPNVIAGIDWSYLGRQLRPYARANAVGADQNVGVFDPIPGKLNPHAALILIDPLEITAEMVMRVIDFRAKQTL